MGISLPSNNIILIGFMGSGKSSVGRALAKKIGFMFLDSDTLIEDFENRKISDIFDKDGESYFRALESKVTQWFQENIQRTVVATGGGLPIQNELSSKSKVIYLYADFDIIKSRLTDAESAKRPLFSDLSKAKDLYEKRHIIYEKKADYMVDVNAPIDKITDAIIDLLSNS